ncbi:MAG: hypothetical protein K2X41_04445 [Hyphomicrobium sp.]|nr:hypothetical protein [Hyphomicrobium sp.]
MSTSLDTLLETIAREVLNIPKLATRGRDALDFHDVGVVSLKRALARAYAAGCEATAKQLVTSLTFSKGDRP